MTDTESRTPRADRDEVFIEFTRSICPVCKTVIDAEVNVKDNRVFMRKRCREHGTFEALDTVAEMIDRIEGRLVFLRLARSPALAGVDTVFAGVDLARQAVADGHLGYGLLVAQRPNA